MIKMGQVDVLEILEGESNGLILNEIIEKLPEFSSSSINYSLNRLNNFNEIYFKMEPIKVDSKYLRRRYFLNERKS